MIKTTQILASFAFVLIAPAAHSVPVIYDEFIDGDLDGSQTHMFDVGTNSVSGVTSWGGAVLSTSMFSILLLLPGPNLLQSSSS